MDFSAWSENTEFNNRTIQHALRDTDERTLGLCLYKLSEEEREVIWRNMSGAAIEMVRAKIADFERGGDVPETSIRTAEDFFRGRLEKYGKWLRENSQRPADEPPKLATATPEDLRRTFTALRRFINDRVPTGWGEVDTTGAHPLMAKGIELLAEDWDPVTIQGILERLGTSLIEREQRRVDMIVRGFDLLCAYELPQVIDEVLKSYDPT